LPSELVRKRYWSKKYPLCLKGVKLLNSKSSLFNESSVVKPSASVNRSLNLTTELNESLDSSSSSLLDPNTLILFARTDREKEEWFKLLKKASAKKLLDSNHYNRLNKSKLFKENLNLNKLKSSSTAQIKTLATPNEESNLLVKQASTESNDGNKANNGSESAQNTPNNAAASTSAVCTQTENGLLYDSSITFMNTFLIRIFADFFTHERAISLIQTKIQNKLNKIRVPHFMEELKIIGLDLGSVVPLIKQTSEPWYDEKGLWVHMEIDYSGGLQMSLATKLNLMKFKANSSTHATKSLNTPSSSSANGNVVFSFKNTDSDESSLSMISSSPPLAGAGPEAMVNGQDVNSDSASLADKQSKKHKRHLAIVDSAEEDSPESSGDEYVHTDLNDEENKLIET
jgi:hypothetical protein